jgi:hypothetical protein
MTRRTVIQKRDVHGRTAEDESGATRTVPPVSPQRDEDLLAAVSAVLAAPGDRAPASLGLLGRESRSTCVLFRLVRKTEQGEAQILVKQRLPRAATRVGEGQGRPRTARVLNASAQERARLEFVGLQRLASAASGSSEVRAVQPLALLPEHAAVIMEYVPLPTLRSALTRSRRSPQLRRSVQHSAFTSVGRALRAYHDVETRAPERPSRPPRGREELAELLRSFADYLRPRGLGQKLSAEVQRCADALAGSSMPDFARSVGHNDFSPRNVLINSGGEVRVIDPLPAWRQPVFDDLAAFVIGTNLTGLQLAGRGLPFRRRELASYETAFLSGYFSGEEVPWPEVLAFQLLAVLDRWAWTASAAFTGRPGDGPGLVKRWWAQPVFGSETARLVEEFRVAVRRAVW